MSTITCILSGKDGVGKSTVAALVGEQLALLGRSVLLVEFEEGLRCLDQYVGANQSKVFDLDDVLNGRCELDDAIAVSSLSDKLSVIFAANGKKRIDTEQFSTLVLAVSDRFDHVIIDTDCSVETLDSISSFSMNNIVVSTADNIGTRDAKFVCDRLYDMSITGVKVLFNRVRRDYIADGITPNLDTAMDNVGVPLIGVMTENPDVIRCTSRGILPKKNSQTYKVFNAIALRLEGESVPLVVI